MSAKLAESSGYSPPTIWLASIETLKLRNEKRRTLGMLLSARERERWQAFRLPPGQSSMNLTPVRSGRDKDDRRYSKFPMSKL